MFSALVREEGKLLRYDWSHGEWAGAPDQTLAWWRSIVPEQEDGGVSQFRYLRDNTLLVLMHVRLLTGFLIRLPLLILMRLNLIRKLNRSQSPINP